MFRSHVNMFVCFVHDIPTILFSFRTNANGHEILLRSPAYEFNHVLLIETELHTEQGKTVCGALSLPFPSMTANERSLIEPSLNLFFLCFVAPRTSCSSFCI